MVLFKDEATIFNSDIANNNNFKSFEYKAKLFENTVAQDVPNQANVKIDMSLKYLSEFWRSLEMSLINCIVELKHKCIKCCILSAAGADNDNANPNNIIFTIKSTKSYVPVVNFSAKDNQKLLKLLSKGFQGSVYWNEYKTKSENKNTKNEYRFVYYIMIISKMITS